MNLILFWAVWMLGVVVSHAASANNNNAVPNVENKATEDQQQLQQQQQRRENEMNMDQTTTVNMPVYTIITNVTTRTTTSTNALPPCGCQQTLTRLACSASTMQFETYILARLASLANLPTTFTSDIVKLLQDNMVSAYNELQTLHHCDRPYFREMLSAELLAPPDDADDTTGLDELYLNFKVIIQSHLDDSGNGPPEQIALAASSPTTRLRTRLLQQQQQQQQQLEFGMAAAPPPPCDQKQRQAFLQQHDEQQQQQEETSSSSSSTTPLLRQRQLQTNVDGACTCPTALAVAEASMDGFTSEAELQQEYNERLLMLFGTAASGTAGNNSIDEVLQLSLVEDQSGQCKPRGRRTRRRSLSTAMDVITHEDPFLSTTTTSTTSTSTTTTGSVVTPMQQGSPAASFETVFIMHVELQPGWQQYGGGNLALEEIVADLVEMQMRLLQDSYNDEAFRNCDSYFRRIISTMPILVEDTNSTVRRKRQRHLQLQQTLLGGAEEEAGDVDGGDDVDVDASSSLMIMMGKNHSSSSAVDDSKQPEPKSASSLRLLFQPILSSGGNVEIYDDMAMLAFRATVECLSDNCPVDQKALANSVGAAASQPEEMTRRSRRLLQERNERMITTAAASAAAGLRGNSNSAEATTTSTTMLLHGPDVSSSSAAIKDAAAAAHHDDGPQQRQRHLQWSDIMGGCYCPSHLEGTQDAPTNETLINAMNENMQLLDDDDQESLVELVTAIYEVDIYDCSNPRSDFETVVSATMVGNKDLVTIPELTALGDGFESTYNSIVFQTCDPYFRSIEAVEVFIPPQEDPVRRRQRLLLKNGLLEYNSTTFGDDKDDEQRMLQSTSKKPFVSGYAVKGKCVGICPKQDTLFTGGFGTRQRQRRDATTTADDAADEGIGKKRVPTEQELRSWIQSSPASLAFAAFQRGLQLQEEQCTCATGSIADEVYSGPTMELFNRAYSLKVEELIAQGQLENVTSVEIVEETLLCKCKTPVATSCAIPIDYASIDGLILLDNDQYPCNLSCDEFDEIFGADGRRRRRQRQLHDLGCDHGIFVCPSDDP